MNHLRLSVAWRYVYCKKSHNAINIISAISAAGVAVATMAMVCTLSVFNGFGDLLTDLYTSFDPELQVTPRVGDAMDVSVAELIEAEAVTPVLESQALVLQGDQQVVVSIKGVADNWVEQSTVETILYPEPPLEVELTQDVLDYGILGIQLAVKLGLTVDFPVPLTVYAPRPGERVDLLNPMQSFRKDELYSPGYVFMVKQTKYDSQYIITSLSFAQRLFDRPGKCSAIEVKGATKADVQATLGPDYIVRDRMEQQDDVFRIMRMEKFIAYLFLTFILLVASFNIVGSLSMLLIDKRHDAQTLLNLGLDRRHVVDIFVIEGRLVSFIGAVVGVLIGLALCWAQQRFGLITMGQSEGAFIVEAYPVSVRLTDLALVLLTVVLVTWLVAWLPVRRMARRMLPLALASVCFALMSCGGKDAPKLPQSKGLPCELLVVTDREITGDLRDSVASVTEADAPGLGSGENIFRVNNIGAAGYSSAFWAMHSKVFFRIVEGKEARVGVIYNNKAKPQIEVYVDAPTPDAMRHLISTQRQHIQDLLLEFQIDRLRLLQEKRYAQKVSASLESIAQMTIKMPTDMVATKHAPDFLWAGSNRAERDINFLYYTYPLEGEPLDGFVEGRDSVLALNVPGSMPGQYMTTSRAPSGEPVVWTRQRDGRTEVRGLWELHAGFMGGPFVAYLYADSAKGRVQVTEAFVFNPNGQKRDLMRQLEGALRTMRRQ